MAKKHGKFKRMRNSAITTAVRLSKQQTDIKWKQEMNDTKTHEIQLQPELVDLQTTWTCLCVCVCLSVSLSVCLSVCESVCLWVCLSVCQSVSLSVSLSVSQWVCLSVFQSVCQSVDERADRKFGKKCPTSDQLMWQFGHGGRSALLSVSVDNLL